MPEYIIESAEKDMDQSQLNMERIISELEENEKETRRLREELEIETNSAKQLRQRLAEKEKNLTEKKEDILEKARAEAREIVDDAKNVADEAIRDYNKWLRSPSKVDARTLEMKRSDIRKKRDSYGEKKKDEKKKYSGHKLTDFHIGDKVLVLSLETEGRIIELPDKNGSLLVEMGILTSRFPANDLLIIDEDKLKTKNAAETFRYVSSGLGGSGKAMNFKPEINLLGKTVDEAIAELDKYLDDALLTHAETVRIVHGKGTGALRKGITEYLKKKSFVKDFRLGEFGEGDAGVTIVKL
jgi:DNA mismatch repair protein MutS2